MRHLFARPLVVGTWLTIVFVLGLALLMNNAPWIGDPLWGQTTVARLQLLGFGLLAASCALDGARDASGIRNLLQAPDLTPRHTWRTILAWWLPGAVIVTLAHLAVVVVSSLAPLNFHNKSYWLLVTQLLGILVTISFGYALGVATRTWGIAVAAGVIWSLAIFGEQAGWITFGITEFAPAGTMLGYAPDGVFFLKRGLFLLALALALGAVVITHGWRAIASVCTALTILAAGRPLFGGSDGYQFVEPSESICVGHEPEVCGPAELRARLAAGQAIAARANGVMRKTLLASPPERYDAWSAQTDSSHKPTLFLFNPGNIRAPMDAGLLVDWVVAPRSCPQWFAPTAPPQEWFTAERVVRGFVETQLYGGSSVTDYAQLVELIHDPERRLSLVRASAQGLTTCDSRVLPRETLRLLE